MHRFEVFRWRRARRAAAAAAAARGKAAPLWFGRATETVESDFRPMGVEGVVALFNYTYPRAGTAATRDYAFGAFHRARVDWRGALVRPLPELLRRHRVGGLVVRHLNFFHCTHFSASVRYFRS